MGRPREHFTCTVDGCDKLHIARGFCGTHYSAWRTATKPAPRQRFTVCTVDGCDRPAQSRGMCHAHYSRWHRNGDAGSGTVRPAFSPAWTEHGQWKGDSVSYVGGHRRILKLRGQAFAYPCDECGAPALDWAYIHGSSDERYDIKTRRVFSADPCNYRPLCRGCHQTEDKHFALSHAPC